MLVAMVSRFQAQKIQLISRSVEVFWLTAVACLVMIIRVCT